MSLWEADKALDGLLSKLQMDAVETHIQDRFTINRRQRNKTRMQIKDLVEKHYIKRSEVKGTADNE